MNWPAPAGSTTSPLPRCCPTGGPSAAGGGGAGYGVPAFCTRRRLPASSARNWSGPGCLAGRAIPARRDQPTARLHRQPVPATLTATHATAHIRTVQEAGRHSVLTGPLLPVPGAAFMLPGPRPQDRSLPVAGSVLSRIERLTTLPLRRPGACRARPSDCRKKVCKADVFINRVGTVSPQPGVHRAPPISGASTASWSRDRLHEPVP
jgi:hypothetical protein